MSGKHHPSSSDNEGFQVPMNDSSEQEEDFLSEFDLSRFLLVTRRTIVWVLLLIFIGIFGSYTFLRYSKPVFESTSILKLENKNDAVVLGLDQTREAQVSNLRNLSGEIEFIKSPLVFEKTLQQINLDVSVFNEGKILNEEKYKDNPVSINYLLHNPAFYNLRFDIKFLGEKKFSLSFQHPNKEKFNAIYSFGQTITLPDITLEIKETEKYSDELQSVDFFFIINSRESLMAYLEENLDVAIMNVEANTLKVSFKDHNPAKARDIVKTIDEVYLEETIKNKSKTQEQTLKFLEENLELTEAKLASSEKRLESFMKENKTANVKDDLSDLMKKIADFENQKITLRMRVTAVEELQNLIIANKDLKGFTPSLVELNDPQLLSLISELAELYQEKEIALSHSKENTYVVKSLNISIENLKASILNAVSQNRKLLFQQLSQIENQVTDLEKNFLTLPGKETEFTRIKRFYDLYEKYYLLLMEKKAEYGIAKAGNVPNFVVLAPAEIMKTPIYPNKLSIYLTGLGLGLFLGLGLIFLRYILDNTITSPRDLEKGLKVPLLGAIPAYSKEKMEFSKIVVNKNPKSAISESLRSIRTNLEFMSGGNAQKVISITSTISGEGKTFIAVNLAGIIAMSDQRVIILDLDMRKPKVHKAFNLNNHSGVSTILINKTSIEDAIQKSDIPTLDVISAGPTPPNPSELLLRPEFDQLINTLQKTYSVIIMDTPPVGLVTDGVLIMKRANLPIYVVRANYSKKAFRNNINKLYRTTAFNNLSVILNGMSGINEYGYGGYGYGYGKGSGYYDTDATRPGVAERLKTFLKD